MQQGMRGVTMGQEVQGRRDFVQHATFGAVALNGIQPAQAGLFGGAAIGKWERVELPESAKPPVLFDIDFDDKDSNHGWVVGTSGTFLETFDAGKTWNSKRFSGFGEDDDINYRYETVSFNNNEGWIIGKPTILLHTTDDGKTWERLPFSSKLPGDPVGVVALGSGRAELSTSAGAIYTTENAGRNWKAQVKETIDATLNRVSSSGVGGASYFAGTINSVQRDKSGAYLAVSSRGNFYLTWTPGDDFWIPHNRNSAKRISNMGFIGEDISRGLWMTSKGGGLSASPEGGVDLQSLEIPFEDLTVKTGGYGLLDVAARTNTELWAVGGGGKIYVSGDTGKSWKPDVSGDNQPANFYKIKWFGQDKGFILGSGGVMMRYVG